MPTVAPRTLDDLLAFRLAVAGRLLRTLADVEFSAHGVGAQALGLVLRLAEQDGQTQVELARQQRVEGPTVCRMVDRLEREGLVERRGHPRDRRATCVFLTPRGRDVAREAGGRLHDLEERAFACLDADERATLAGLLARVMVSLPSAGPA